MHFKRLKNAVISCNFRVFLKGVAFKICLFFFIFKELLSMFANWTWLVEISNRHRGTVLDERMNGWGSWVVHLDERMNGWGSWVVHSDERMNGCAKTDERMNVEWMNGWTDERWVDERMNGCATVNSTRLVRTPLLSTVFEHTSFQCFF